MGDSGSVEIFIACTKCRYEDVLRVSTPEIEALLRKHTRLRSIAGRQKQRYGQVFARIEREMKETSEEIFQRKRALNAD